MQSDHPGNPHTALLHHKRAIRNAARNLAAAISDELTAAGYAHTAPPAPSDLRGGSPGPAGHDGPAVSTQSTSDPLRAENRDSDE